MSKWISVKDTPPRCPCLGLDKFNQIFILREMVCFEVNEEQIFFDGLDFDFAKMGFREMSIPGGKVKLMKEVKYWMPFPEMPND